MESVVANGKLVTIDTLRSGFSLPLLSANSTVRLRLFVNERPSFGVSVARNVPISFKCRALSGVDKSDTQSVASEFIEKEFGFKPMFDDYVKVMQSVQIDRSQQQPELDDDGGYNLERGSGSKRNGKKRFGIQRRDDVWTNQNRFQNHRNVRGDAKFKDRRIENFDDGGGERRRGSSHVNEQKRSSGMEKIKGSSFVSRSKSPECSFQRSKSKERTRFVAEENKVYERYDQKFLSEGKTKRYQSTLLNVMKEHRSNKKENERSEIHYGNDMLSRANTNIERKKPEFHPRSAVEKENGRNIRINNRDSFEVDSYGSGRTIRANLPARDIQGIEEPSTSLSADFSSNVYRRVRNQNLIRLDEDSAEMEHASKTLRIYKRSGKSEARDNSVSDRDVDSVDLDRAAFKTYEEFTDFRDRPRVLRKELEVNIQNLAKWLNATDVNMPEWQFSRMMHNAKIKFTDHTILRVVQILGEFGNWRRVLQVVEWLQLRERFKSYKSKYIYTAVLDALGKAKRPREALNIFYAMLQERSSYPDLATYHCIAVILGQAGLMKELFDVMDCMKSHPKKKFNLGFNQKWDPRLEPDLVVYNAVLNACVQQKQWEGAFWVLQQLKTQYIRPSGTTYGLVMEAMLAGGKYDLVHEYFKKIEKTSIPSTLSYKVLVNTLWREGKTEEAVLAVQDMERRGIVGSASLYYDLARCLCSAGKCQEALMQVGKVCKVAKKPLVVTYTGLIQACLDSGSIENAAYIFKEMQRFCSPNVVTCNIMLKSYLDHGKYDQAKDLFQRLVDGSRPINTKEDLRGKVVPDRYTFNTMMEASIAAEEWEDFENVYIQMFHHGYHFDKKRHLRMVMEATRAGKVKVLDVTWEKLVQSGRNLPPSIIKEKLRNKLMEGDCTAAVSCLYGQESDEPHAFSADSWLNLLKFNSENFNQDTIVSLVGKIRHILEEKDHPPALLQNLLTACVKFLGRTDHVLFEIPELMAHVKCVTIILFRPKRGQQIISYLYDHNR